jgi:hypothetical protein
MEAVRNILTCQNSEWTQRHMEYNESETLMVSLQDLVPDKQRSQKLLQ